MNNHIDPAFRDYYRCPENFAAFTPAGDLSEDSGYFCLGSDLICYGRSSAGFRADDPARELYDVAKHVVADGFGLKLPFNASEIVANFRYERYLSHSNGHKEASRGASILRNGYYFARPLLPVSVRQHLQRIHLHGWNNISFPRWPVDASVERTFEKMLAFSLQTRSIDYVPFIWFWPDGYPSCAMMTHDVETERGRDFCSRLMDLDDAYGVKASFQIVPERRYAVSADFIDSIWDRGFEVNVHDLNHDGHLVGDRPRFRARANLINEYARAYRAAGFRSGSLYRALDWWQDLDVSYDMSVPSVGHIEAQRGGCCSVTPFFVGHILELPVTAVQDYSLFYILKQFSVDLWVKQIDAISRQHGLLNFIVHPDYVIEHQARNTYTQLLAHLASLRDGGHIWMALPQQVNKWWRQRADMRLVCGRTGWTIEGEGRERAQVAYASLQGDRLIYALQPPDHTRPRNLGSVFAGNSVALAS